MKRGLKRMPTVRDVRTANHGFDGEWVLRLECGHRMTIHADEAPDKIECRTCRKNAKKPEKERRAHGRCGRPTQSGRPCRQWLWLCHDGTIRCPSHGPEDRRTR